MILTPLPYHMRGETMTAAYGRNRIRGTGRRRCCGCGRTTTAVAAAAVDGMRIRRLDQRHLRPSLYIPSLHVLSPPHRRLPAHTHNSNSRGGGILLAVILTPSPVDGQLF